MDLISFEVGQSELVIDCEGEVETMDTAGITGKHRGFAPLWYFLRSTDLTKAGTGIRKLVRSVTESGDDEISQLHNLSDDIRKQVSYETGSSDVKTSAEEVITEGRESVRIMHMFSQCCTTDGILCPLCEWLSDDERSRDAECEPCMG